MPGLLMHIGAGCKCTHLATATIAPSQTRVLVSGQAVALMSSQITVAGCPFQVPAGVTTKPQPCVTVKWSMPSARVKILGQPAMLIPTPGPGPAICQSIEQIPAGPPTVGPVQARVIAT
jgi:hypothetical protein